MVEIVRVSVKLQGIGDSADRGGLQSNVLKGFRQLYITAPIYRFKEVTLM